MQPRRYAPLGRCMYCLATGVRLTEEHLIPKAIGGRLTLRDAACEPCRARTGRLEQATLDRDFAIPKTLLAMKRKRARKPGPRRLPTIALSTGPGSNAREADLSASRYPRSFTLPAFAPAGLLSQVDRATAPPRVDDVSCRLQLGTIRDEAEAAARPLADPLAYGFSIAKWAYSLAVAERGLACCDTRAIRALLAGGRIDVFNFVGNVDPAERVSRDWLHGVALQDRDGWLVVRLALFGSAGMRPYEVAIGALDAVAPPA